jgi:hypothetical protein
VQVERRAGACAGGELQTIMEETGSPAPVELLLKSKDGEIFKVEKSIAMQINFVKGMLEGSIDMLSHCGPYQKPLDVISSRKPAKKLVSVY